MDSSLLSSYDVLDLKLLKTTLAVKPTISSLLLALPILLGVCHTFYNLYFHPFAKYPGPKFAAASRIWWIYHLFSGTLSERTLQLHIKYGPVVRVAPSEIVFVEPDAWKDIYGHRYGVDDVRKDPREFINMDPNIVFSDRAQHARYRKQFSHGFSDKSLREQEPVLQQYTKVFVQRLAEQGQNGAVAFNVSTWYLRTIADIVSHLTFGDPFHCLDATKDHPFLIFIANAAYHLTFVRGLQRIPGARHCLHWLVPSSLLKTRTMLEDMMHDKLEHRRTQKLDYTDLMTNLLKAESEGELTPVELESNAKITVIAGVETSETLLNGATWYILRHPRVFEKLKAEIRGSFASESEITCSNVSNLPYLEAVIEESLRVYTPAAVTLVRVTPPEGSTVCGEYIPANLNIGVNIFAAARYPGNWAEPTSFVPERWLLDDKDAQKRFANDKREALQPFSHGPRNCIGRGLAYMAIRLILVNLFYRYEVELAPGMETWSKQLIYGGFRRYGKPLMVKMRPVERQKA